VTDWTNQQSLKSNEFYIVDSDLGEVERFAFFILWYISMWLKLKLLVSWTYVHVKHAGHIRLFFVFMNFGVHLYVDLTLHLWTCRSFDRSYVACILTAADIVFQIMPTLKTDGHLYRQSLTVAVCKLSLNRSCFWYITESLSYSLSAGWCIRSKPLTFIDWVDFTRYVV